MIDDSKLEKYKKNLITQYQQITEQIKELGMQRLEVKGALRFVNQLINSSGENRQREPTNR